METIKAFANNLAARARGARSRVFDWNKAAKLIAENKPMEAGAGLSGDWEWTGGSIWKDGAPVPRDETYTYLASTWAIPELDMDGDIQPCWVFMDEADGWNESTYWPDDTAKIAAGEPHA